MYIYTYIYTIYVKMYKRRRAYICAMNKLLVYKLSSQLDYLITILKSTSTGYGMHQQVEHFNNCTLCPHCVYVFCICLITNSDLCHLQHKLIDCDPIQKICRQAFVFYQS
jgi:hypothetical protein